MDARIVTAISGVVLLVVFALVGWRLNRRRDEDEPESD